ncbi:MAG: hypothetical protein KAT05_03610 [Spirochaetes bacterium]|nr:hypothetical protein [Spirochaetota bacterium]
MHGALIPENIWVKSYHDEILQVKIINLEFEESREYYKKIAGETWRYSNKPTEEIVKKTLEFSNKLAIISKKKSDKLTEKKAENIQKACLYSYMIPLQ